MFRIAIGCRCDSRQTENRRALLRSGPGRWTHADNELVALAEDGIFRILMDRA